MKSGKVLCRMFLLAVLEVDSAQNMTKYKRWLCVAVLIQLNDGSIVIP